MFVFLQCEITVNLKIRILLYSMHIIATDLFDEELIDYFYQETGLS